MPLYHCRVQKSNIVIFLFTSAYQACALCMDPVSMAGLSTWTTEVRDAHHGGDFVKAPGEQHWRLCRIPCHRLHLALVMCQCVLALRSSQIPHLQAINVEIFSRVSGCASSVHPSSTYPDQRDALTGHQAHFSKDWKVGNSSC